MASLITRVASAQSVPVNRPTPNVMRTVIETEAVTFSAQFTPGVTERKITSDDLKKFAGEHKFELYDSYEKMLQHPGLDAVVLATPHSLHRAQVIACAKVSCCSPPCAPTPVRPQQNRRQTRLSNFRRAAFVVAVASVVSAPALAQTDQDTDVALEMNFGSVAQFKDAFNAIQQAVEADDAEAFALWVSYPFKVTVDGEAYSFEGPEGVVEHYQSMMTEEIKTAIVGQQYKDLFVNAGGVMFGDGQLWMTGICSDDACEAFEVKIITVQSTAN
jgi:hypothetical protein